MRWISLVVGLLLASWTTAQATVRDDIIAALARVAELKPMETGRTHSLPARGETMTGANNDFLRRREPNEILSSGLSTGCGDYAAAFYGLLRAKGASLLWIDSAELSATSLLDQSDGHTGVAVKDPETRRWILVDPTGEDLSDINFLRHGALTTFAVRLRPLVRGLPGLRCR
jgi:hypothetical protein